MQYLLFDTCIWLNLATKPELRPLLKRILANLNQDQLRILLSNIIIEEYKRNKDTTISDYTQPLKTHLKNAKKAVKDYLDDSEYYTFELLLKKANDNIDKSAKEGINTLDIIESIFKHKNTILLSTSDRILIHAAQIALKKQAPCHGKKNSVADAVIYLQFENWVKKSNSAKDKASFHFVTDNTTDFSKNGEDKREPHEDLRIFDEKNVYYHVDLYKALEKLELEDIPLDEFDLFQSRLQMNRDASSPCISKDGHLFNDNKGRWSFSECAGGLSWHLVCTRCEALQDTGHVCEE